MPENQIVVVLCTCPDPESARAIARSAVNEGLAACVNILPGVVSVYRWQGQLQEDGEVLLLMKTAADRVPVLAARVREQHRYELPEVVAVPVSDGLDEYLTWVAESVPAGNTAP